MPWSEETFAGNAFVSKKEKDVKNKDYSLTSKMRMFNVKILNTFFDAYPLLVHAWYPIYIVQVRIKLELNIEF